MPSFMNTLGAVSRRGQWRFREVLRAARADGRVDLSDDGLIDFTTASDIVLTVSRRPPSRLFSQCEAGPVLTASTTAGTLVASNPGIVEAVFPAGTLMHLPAGLYDVRIIITIGPESAEIYDEPIEFA